MLNKKRLLAMVAAALIVAVCYGVKAEMSEYKTLKTLQFKGPVNAAIWNQDSSQLAVLSEYGGTVTVYQSPSFDMRKQFHRYGGGYMQNSFAFALDNSLYTSAPIGDYSSDPHYAGTSLVDTRYKSLQQFALIQWNASTGTAAHYIPNLIDESDSERRAAAVFRLSPDGKLAAVIVTGTQIFLYDLNTSSLLRTISVATLSPSPHDFAVSLAFSRGGKRLAVGTQNGHVLLLDTLSWESVADVRFLTTHQFSVRSINFSFDDKYLAAGLFKNFDFMIGESPTTKDEAAIRAIVVDANNGSAIARIPTQQGRSPFVRSLEWDPARYRIAIADDEGCTIWSAAGNEYRLVEKLTSDRDISSLKFSNNGELAVAQGSMVTIYK